MAVERTPVEIWSQILREATRLPSRVFDGTLYDPIKPKGSSIPQTHPKEIYPFILSLFDTKLSFSLVCRSWKQICSEFLYESLFINRAETVSRLVNKFKTIDMNLHKVFRIDFYPSYTGTFGDISSASELVSLCPFLLAVAFHDHIFDVEDPVFVTLLRSSSLRCFEWHTHQRLPNVIASPLLPARNWSLFINYVSGSGYAPRWESGVNDIVQRDIMCNENGFLEEGNLQELQRSEPSRHMILGSWINMDLPLDPNDVIHTINILTLNKHMFRYSSDFLSNLPPGIHTLLIYVKDIPASLASVAQHIKRIGLKGTSMPSSTEFDHYFNILIGNNTSHIYFPSLQILQLHDLPLATALRTRPHQLRLWAHRCSSKGILLCDEFGNQFGSGNRPGMRKFSVSTLMNKSY